MSKQVNIETLHKEIDLIQGVINRMAHNSFLLKGWIISLIVAVLAFTKDSLLTDKVQYLELILLVPLVLFWYLDSFFLHKERCFRKLYVWVINNRRETMEHAYSLNYKRFESEVDSVWNVMLSKTLVVFYGLATVALTCIYIISNW